MENNKENKQKPAAIDMKYVSGVRMNKVQVRGYETALRAEHVHELDMKNFSAEKNNIKLNPKWYRDKDFWVEIYGKTIEAILSWFKK